jgi:hypothetical protein
MAYRPNDHYVTCDICGGKFYRSECFKTWNNLIVCPQDFDGPRNPQDYRVRPRADKQNVKNPRPEPNVEPTITSTTSATSITDTTAASGGIVTNDGGSTVTAYGVCWATTTAPTTADNSTSDGTGTGTYTSGLTGLTASTRYYLRAYATNAVGTAYGPTVIFTTTA